LKIRNGSPNQGDCFEPSSPRLEPSGAEDLILINGQNRFFGIVMNKLIWRPTNAPQMKGKCHEKSVSCYGGCHAPNRRCARLRWAF
jgi:hypothetical protein